MRFTRGILIMLAASTILFAGCSSGSSGSSGGGGGGGPTPGYTINATGGTGGANQGDGGLGGSVSLYKEGGTGSIEVLRKGSVDASFTPSKVTANLGPNPAIIAEDTDVPVVAGAGDKPEEVGSLYIYNYRLRLSDGDTTAFDNNEVVTGMRVEAGATLTLALTSATQSHIWFNNDVENRGTITTEDVDATQRGALSLSMGGSYLGDGAIDTSGNQDGQHGGRVDLDAYSSAFVHGPIITAGADSATGNAGNGGVIDIYGSYRVESTGTLASHGGTAAEGAGGDAGWVELSGGYGCNAGDVLAHGGNGADSGGNGAWVYLYSYIGGLLNGGDILTHGGDASAGDGGVGGEIYIYGEGGELRNSGDLITRGGDSSHANGNGGDGGLISVDNSYGYLYQYTPPGDLLISGRIDSSGGNSPAAGSGNGGNGGSVEIELDVYYYPFDQRLALLGYDSIDNSNGDANHPQFDWGYISFYNDYGQADNNVYVAGGSVINEADLIARGGSVPADATDNAAGGQGNNVNLETDYYYGMFHPEGQRVVNRGNIDTRSGDSLGGTTSNRAGGIWIWGYNGVTNSGDLLASGGNDAAADGGITGYGNRGNWLELYAELGPIQNTGALDASGGYGEYRGGSAGGVYLLGQGVTNSGPILAAGGDANPGLTNSVGGYGDWIWMYAPGTPDQVKNSGDLDVSGGIGATAGYDGVIHLGGLCVSGDDC